MNPCEEYELLLSARLDGALSLKEETQLHAHLAQCPHCRQLAQELEDLQTQMTSLWVEPPDSLKDALASQDWSKSASSSPPRSPTASPSKRRHLLPWLACAAAAVVLVVGLCQLLLPGGADGLLPKAVIEVFQRPAARKAIPPPPTTQTARKTLRRIQSSRQNRTEETPRGRPRPLRTGPPPQTTRRTRSPRPITTKPPTTPPIPPVIPPQGTPAQTHLPTTTQGTNPTIPPPPR